MKKDVASNPKKLTIKRQTIKHLRVTTQIKTGTTGTCNLGGPGIGTRGACSGGCTI